MKLSVVKSTENKFDIDHGSYMGELYEVLEEAKKEIPGDIYIMSIPRVEVFPKKVFKKRFISREMCPMPHYDQTLFKYWRTTDHLELLWTLPEQHHCEEMKEDSLNIHPDWKEVLAFVIDYYDGTLTKKAVQFNKEDQFRSNIVLRSYTDDQMTNKEKHSKKMKEIHDQRKRTKLY